MDYLIKFSYDGTNFFGFQKQPNLRTVEDEFEKDDKKNSDDGKDNSISSNDEDSSVSKSKDKE